MKNIKVNDLVCVNNKEYIVGAIDFDENIYLREIESPSEENLKVTLGDISVNKSLDSDFLRRLHTSFHNCAQSSETLLQEIEEIKPQLEMEFDGILQSVLTEKFISLIEPLRYVSVVSEILAGIIDEC